MTEVLGYEFRCAWPNAGTVRIVVRPHESVEAVLWQELAADSVLDEGTEDVAIQVVTRGVFDCALPAQACVRAEEAVLVVVEFLREERDPADASFRKNNIQARIAVENARRDDIARGFNTVPLVAEGAVGHESASLRGNEVS